MTSRARPAQSEQPTPKAVRQLIRTWSRASLAEQWEFFEWLMEGGVIPYGPPPLPDEQP
jgi:hypothetical protein